MNRLPVSLTTLPNFPPKTKNGNAHSLVDQLVTKTDRFEILRALRAGECVGGLTIDRGTSVLLGSQIVFYGQVAFE